MANGRPNALLQMQQPTWADAVPIASRPDTIVNEQHPDTFYLPKYGPIPTEMSPDTYTGVIPTPPSDFGPTRLEIPHGYQRFQNLMRPDDPQIYNMLLREMLRNKNSRRA